MGDIIIIVFIFTGIFFAGRYIGIVAEMAEWIKSSREGVPMIRDGEVFMVKNIGGD